MFKTRDDTRYIVLCRVLIPGQGGLAEITKSHRARGGLDCGFHYVVNSSGDLELGRADHLHGWHTPGYNATSVSVAFVARGKHSPAPFDHPIIEALRVKYPNAEVVEQEDLAR